MEFRPLSSSVREGRLPAFKGARRGSGRGQPRAAVFDARLRGKEFRGTDAKSRTGVALYRADGIADAQSDGS